FKLEIGKSIEELRQIAFDFLTRNRCDLVIANDLQEIEGGRHTGYFVTPDGKVKESAGGKEAIARALAEYLEEHLDSGAGPTSVIGCSISCAHWKVAAT